MLRSILLTILTCQLIVTSLSAQLASLKEKLRGKDKLEEIMNIVHAHYEEIESGARPYAGEPRLKHWQRWGYYMSSRTDGEGRLVDVDRQLRRAYDNYNTQQRISTGNWITRGPNAISGTYGSAAGIARVDRVAFHPTNENVIYIGTPSGGLFRSVTGGASWTAMTDNIPSVSVSGIVVTPSDPDRIYILTGDGDSNIGGLVEAAGYMRTSAGVFVSHDAGVNWHRTGNFPVSEAFVGYNLAQDPNNPNVLLAATSLGLFRTANGGNSWTQEVFNKTFEVKFKPGSSSIAYCTTDGFFMRSTDGGLTWAIADFGDDPLPNGRVALAVTPANANVVYVMSGNAPASEVDACGDDPTETFGGVYLSVNSGESFQQQCNSPNLVESCCSGENSRSQSYYDLALAVSSNSILNLVAGGILAWRSTTAGVSWSNASADNCDAESTSTGFVHADVHDIEYNPANGDVYLCSDGGLIKSTNNGIDWVSLSDGIVASQAYHMAGSLTDIDNMIIGLQDNGCKRRNSNTSTWDNTAGGDGFDCIYDWESSTTGYMTSNSAVYRFINNGSTRTNVTGDNAAFFTRVTSGINNPLLVLAGRSDIYKSVNGGSSWSNKGASGYWDLERCPSNQNRFYAAGGSSYFSTTGNMYFSSDMGDTWDNISNNPGYPEDEIRLTDIGVRPNNSGNVWIVFGGFSDGNKVFYSQLSGSSWVNMSGSLPNVPVNAIQVDANNNVYIGTDIGVFYRGASMDDWVPFWHRLPIVPVTDLELYEANGILRASTFGRGVWESSTYSTCSATLTLTTNLSGNRYYETSDWITCSSIISGGQNTQLLLKAANSITLTTGFEAKKGNTVYGYTAPCGEAQIED